MNNKLSDNLEETTIMCPSDSFTYRAKVRVSLMKNNRKYFTKEYHNHGRWPLFAFLSNCLAGNYSTADALRPRFINLFDFGLSAQETSEPQIVDGTTRDDEKISHYFNDNTVVTLMAYPTMSAADLSTKEEQIGSSTTTFKFTIPFTQIRLNSETKAIEGFALYPAQTNSSEIQNPSVYFFLTNKEGKVINLLDGFTDIDDEEYNLYVEWILSITNQQTR